MTNDAIPAELRNEMDDSERLLNLVKQLASDVTDPKILEQVADIEAQFASAKKIVSQPPSAYSLPDMPEECLDGFLGKLCQKYLWRYPRAYAWIALVTVASALVPRRSQSQKFNIYGVPVGPVGSGKTETIRAAQTLLHISTPELLDAMVGSGEGLMQRIADAFGSPRLYSPDELSHLLTKMAIQNSSFPSILTRAFNYDQFEVIMAKGKRVQFHASLSILGGVVDEKFGDLFGAASTLGLFDRCLIGACPSGFVLSYAPFEDPNVAVSPASIFIDPDVWVEKELWTRNHPAITPRCAELAIRVASICASFDRRSSLCAADLGPAFALAEYQSRIRQVYKPNPGENLGGRVAEKILSYLQSYGGRFVGKREMERALNLNRYDPRIAESVYACLKANGQIEEQKTGRTKPKMLVRLVPDEPTEQTEGDPS